MAKEMIQRMYDPRREAVSFAIKRGSEFALVDAPLIPGSTLPPNESSTILYSHFHKDHCPQQKGRGEALSPPVYFNPDTLVLLDHIGANTNNLDVKQLTPGKRTEIDGFGTVLPIPVSHSSVDALAFWIELESGSTILYSGDIRSGNRTDRAITKIRELCGKSGVSLFIGDATGVGREHISQQDHLSRLKQALRLAEANQAGTAVFLKAGDYGNIAFWFENHVFENCEVFLSPPLRRVLDNKHLNWLAFLSNRYGYIPPNINQLDEYLKRKKKVVFLYDNCWKNQIGNNKYVLVNSSRREIPYKSDSVVALFPIGFSGHSAQAFADFFEACNPDYVAYSHPPGKGQANIRQKGLVMRRKGEIFST